MDKTFLFYMLGWAGLGWAMTFHCFISDLLSISSLPHRIPP
jgi:hypothetical protein